MRVSIIDCQMGNIGSIVNIIRYIGFDVDVINSPEDILKADKLIFPGVGHWNNGVQQLEESGLKPAILEAVNNKKTPFLGICLGMQLLFDTSEEGDKSGLGIVPGKVVKFDFGMLEIKERTGAKKLRIPHMGWNDVTLVGDDNLVRQSLSPELSYYFVHSFHASSVPKEYQLMTCHYGYDFVCAVNKENVWGFQFHPEKSHKFGMELLSYFLERT
ncbi:imidazole glycerol phosphate synthase subunit HisH [Vibrio scophthalmi]|uniref:Imidazole glycerol phosphate synthase subunit HisH n=1 Tax=Vibrio scophthalmi TaxID=45658 RepID=A0A1E3WJJ8_9VIBR|nr:imidazole glycerol phosphate synthase subunit HisH [Vibrio scophthalmi]ODS09941.1 Imidazole glycerol phosphate synthase subunit HisH [Vibrio scophthalmi]